MFECVGSGWKCHISNLWDKEQYQTRLREENWIFRMTKLAFDYTHNIELSKILGLVSYNNNANG